MDDHDLTIAGLARAYRSRALSSEETISAVLQRIERAESGAEALGARS